MTFEKISLTATGLLTFLVATALRERGIDITESEVEVFVLAFIQFIGATMAFIGQIRRKDLDYGVLRK